MLDEAKNINKSLSALGNVISALADGNVSDEERLERREEGLGEVKGEGGARERKRRAE